MTPERWKWLQYEGPEDVRLTKDEVKEGWHFCFDWDCLLIHKDDPEYDCCTCPHKEDWKNEN